MINVWTGIVPVRQHREREAAAALKLLRGFDDGSAFIPEQSDLSFANAIKKSTEDERIK